MLSNIGRLWHRQPANGEGKGGWIRKINYDGRDSGMKVVQVTKAKNEKTRNEVSKKKRGIKGDREEIKKYVWEETETKRDKRVEWNMRHGMKTAKNEAGKRGGAEAGRTERKKVRKKVKKKEREREKERKKLRKKKEREREKVREKEK